MRHVPFLIIFWYVNCLLKDSSEQYLNIQAGATHQPCIYQYRQFIKEYLLNE